MNDLTIFIVEDDPASLLTLETSLYKLGYTTLLTVDNSTDAIKLIRKEQPDIILMDIEIKGSLNGIEVAKQVKDLQIPLIFISGFDDGPTFNAAKETNPHAYLVKPFNKRTLEIAIDKALESAAERCNTPQLLAEELEAPSSSESGIFLKESFFIKHGTILQRVRFSEIIWIQSDGNYTMIHTENKKIALRISLSKIMKRLPGNIFIRVHKRYAIQAGLIDRIDTSSKELYIKEKAIPMGRTYKDDLLAFLNRM